MKRVLFFLIGFLTSGMIFLSSGLSEELRPKLAILASEQYTDGSYATSFYYAVYGGYRETTLSHAHYNRCESALVAAAVERGWPLLDLSLNISEVNAAYRVKPLFDRYQRNLVGLPNGSVAKIALALDPDIGMVVTCLVKASARGEQKSFDQLISAQATCRMIDLHSGRQVATHRAGALVTHVDRMEGSRQAVTEACQKVAKVLFP